MSCPVCCEDGNDWFRLNQCGHLLCGVCVDRITPAICPECRTDFDREFVQKTYLPQLDKDQADKLRQEIHELRHQNEVLVRLYGELEEVANVATEALCKETAVTEELRSTIKGLRENVYSEFNHPSSSSHDNRMPGFDPTHLASPFTDIFDARSFIPSPPSTPSIPESISPSISSAPRIPPEQSCSDGGPHGPWEIVQPPGQYRCELCNYFTHERMERDSDGFEFWYTYREGWSL
ncbi:hypothetical protein QCA50_004164 [Cerrena zonata]|uniref:RING-type domain-containing protein n=1 Tax=Cerrena zonata TaxID=2478898 RepID=A0AAW0GL54_9APHY